MYSRRRYLLTGAMLGLYFGYFFRPVRDPNFLVVIGLSFVAALVSVAIAKRGGRLTRPFGSALLLSWGQFGLMLAIFEGRHLAYDVGGRVATVLFTTALGALSGLWYSYTTVESTK